jgi:hypothetical protein
MNCATWKSMVKRKKGCATTFFEISLFPGLEAEGID